MNAQQIRAILVEFDATIVNFSREKQVNLEKKLKNGREDLQLLQDSGSSTDYSGSKTNIYMTDATITQTVKTPIPSPNKVRKELYQVKNVFVFDEKDILKNSYSRSNSLWVNSHHVNIEKYRGEAAYIANEHELRQESGDVGLLVEDRVKFVNTLNIKWENDLEEAVINYTNSLLKPLKAAITFDQTVYQNLKSRVESTYHDSQAS